MSEVLSKYVSGFDKSGLAILEPIVRSPVLQGYRNKCEFSVGHHPETNEVAVGFRLASYRVVQLYSGLINNGSSHYRLCRFDIC